jgi:putative phosphoribosyl transferase
MERNLRDRLEAGHELAERLERYGGSDALVLGLARGGVEVAYGLTEALHLPLRALVVRKIGAPFNPELALGAVSETGATWLDTETIRQLHVPAAYLQREMERELEVARERQRRYSIGPDLASLRGRSVIIVDDGIATGASARVAVQSVRSLGAGEVILATPVASAQAVEELRPRVDDLVVLVVPEPFYAVGLFYRDFGQVDDDTVIHYLHQAQLRAIDRREPAHPHRR